MFKKGKYLLAITLLITFLSIIIVNAQEVPIADSFRFPLEGDWSPLWQDFGKWNSQWSGYHLGEDIGRENADIKNYAVYPLADGIVKFADIVMGYTVIIEHKLSDNDPDGDYVCSVYYHMKRPEEGGIKLTIGKSVSMDNPIGYVSGKWEDHKSSPHLHFGIRKGCYKTGKDPKTGFWYYPGYTVIKKVGEVQKNPDDPIHKKILADWFNPSTDPKEGTGFIERHIAKIEQFKVPQDYLTIQEAINSVEDGVIIIVSPGIYPENIDFNQKIITVQSINPNDPEIVKRTVIDGEGKSSVITFKNVESGAILAGFTIKNGIYEYGSGIYIDNSSPTIIQNIIIDNKAINHGGGAGIYIDNNSSPTIINNIISNNSAEWGAGGIYINNNSSPTINNNKILNNIGDGIDICHSSPIIEDNIISNNSAEHGGGISIYKSFPIIKDNNISNNEICGIYIESSSATIENNTIIGNIKYSIYIGWDSSPTINKNKILNNNGTGIWICHSSPIITNNTISGNNDDDFGGIVMYNNSSPTIEGNTISNNKALKFTKVGKFSGTGGIDILDSSPTINNNKILNNIGHAIVINHSSPIITNNIISGNETFSSYGCGISIYYGSSPNINNNTISYNKAYSAAGIFIVNSSPIITNNTISGNEANDFSGCGGGIFIGNNSSPAIEGNTISGNSAKYGGGIYTESNLTNIKDNIICGNSIPQCFPEDLDLSDNSILIICP